MKKLLQNKDKQQIKALLEEMLKRDPHRFGLSMDEFGAVALEDVALATSRRIPWVTIDHILELVEEPHSGLLLEDENIRYASGHQFPVIHPQPVTPPLKLYIATNPMLINSWRHDGAKPLLKRFLCLFAFEEEAWHFATSEENISSPVIVTVDALKAHRATIQFLHSDRTFYCRFIPAQYIRM